MRCYGRWRNSLKWQLDLLKLVADRIKLQRIHKLRDELQAVQGPEGKVEWAELEKALQKIAGIPADQLRRCSKAFGECSGRCIPVHDFIALAEAWRRKRVR